ncbi:Fe2OG dioxygenase domain-containing protein [Cupriavidus sp. H19C3]
MQASWPVTQKRETIVNAPMGYDEFAALTTYEKVIPPGVLAEINAAIDSSFTPQPVRVQPREVADILRQVDAFAQLESSACATTRAFARLMARGPLEDRPHHVLRCVSVANHPDGHCRHFDSHLLTLLIPLQLAAPDAFFNGDLVVYPRVRRRISTIGNVLCKLRHGIQRNLPFALRKRLTLRDLRRGRCTRVGVQPGNVYVFNGFALKHANLHVEAGQRRSLLIHYYDPGFSLGLSKVLRLMRKMRDRLHRNMTGMY